MMCNVCRSSGERVHWSWRGTSWSSPRSWASSWCSGPTMTSAGSSGEAQRLLLLRSHYSIYIRRTFIHAGISAIILVILDPSEKKKFFFFFFLFFLFFSSFFSLFFLLFSRTTEFRWSNKHWWHQIVSSEHFICGNVSALRLWCLSVTSFLFYSQLIYVFLCRSCFLSASALNMRL